MAAPKNEPKIHIGIGFDFETGDLECQTGACTQLSMQAMRLDTLEIIDKYTVYVYPYNKKDFSIKPKKKTLKTKNQLQFEDEEVLMDYKDKALDYSDIKMDTLYKMGVDIKQVAAEVIAFAQKNTLSTGKDCKPVLIGQNSQFDCGFLQQMMNYGEQVKEFEKVFSGHMDFYGNFQPHYIDTIDLGKFALAHDPDATSYKLEIMSERLGIELDDAHDAEADVTATLNVAIVCANRMRNNSGSEGAGLQKTEKSRAHFKI